MTAPIAICSAIVSCITIFTADVTFHALVSLIAPAGSRVYPSVRRYLPVLAMWATNVLGCIPINSMRFGWAYATSREQTLDDALAALVYLLTGGVFLRLHRSDDVESMRFVDKGVVFVVGLFFLALMSCLPETRAECHDRRVRPGY